MHVIIVSCVDIQKGLLVAILPNCPVPKHHSEIVLKIDTQIHMYLMTFLFRINVLLLLVIITMILVVGLKPALSGSKKKWYHGKLSISDAEERLRAPGYDCFLIRRCQEEEPLIVLSLIQDRKACHIRIKLLHGRYSLRLVETPSQTFTGLSELVTHYRNNPISDKVKALGLACEKTRLSTGRYSYNAWL